MSHGPGQRTGPLLPSWHAQRAAAATRIPAATGLANILTVLLAGVVTVITARLASQLLRPGSAHWWRGFTDFRLDLVANITIFGLSILFVVWLRRARINAELHRYQQRRACGWTFWGWIVPIVNLWFPFQIMGDIWRAGLPAQQRHKTAWLPALWWTCWLLSGVSFGAHTMSATHSQART